MKMERIQSARSSTTPTGASAATTRAGEGMLAKVMVCDSGYDRPFLFITAKWTVAQAKEYARTLGFTPLYCVNVWRKI
jgi:hypothetical protein